MERIYVTKSSLEQTKKELFFICPLVKVSQNQKRGLCQMADNLVCGLGLMDSEAPEDCPMRKRSIIVEMVVKEEE